MTKVRIKHLSNPKHRDLKLELGDDKKVEFVKKCLESENAFETVVETFLEGTTFDILKKAQCLDLDASGRKTSWGDVIEVDGDPYMVAEYGFRNLD